MGRSGTPEPAPQWCAVVFMIGELADLAGTTVKSVRHYHATGVLEEPARQHNGYRVYDVMDLVRLSRIKRMRDLGISVARIRDLLDGETADVHAALDALDGELLEQAKTIEARRAKIAALRTSLDPELPEPFARILAEYAEAGAPAGWILQERQRMVLVLNISGGSAEVVDHFLGIHRRVLAEPNRSRGIDIIKRMAALDEHQPDTSTIDELAADFCQYTNDVLPDIGDPARAPLSARAQKLFDLLDEHQAEHRSAGQELFARAVATRQAAGRSGTDWPPLI